MAVVTPTQVAAELGRDLTPAETSRVTQRVAAWTGILEGLLNRGLEITQRTLTKTPTGEGSVAASAQNGWSMVGYGWGVVWLERPPIHTLDKVETVGPDGGAGTDITASCRRDGELRVLVPTLEPVRVTFTSGDEPVQPEVTELVLDAMVRTMSVPAAAAAGLDVSYSVEGESVTYGAQNGAEGRRGPFTKAEIAGLRASLSRMVLR